MANASWTGGSGDWNDSENWASDQVPTSADVVTIIGNAVETITIDGPAPAAAAALILDDSNADLVVATTLDVAGPLVLQTGTIALAGTLENATVLADGGTIEADSGVLQGVTWQGNLDVNNGMLMVQGGLTAESADGAGPGSITIDGANALLAFNDTETFDNATITIGSSGGQDELDANGTLTLGSGVTVQTAATIGTDTLGGQGTLINDGTILDSTAGDFVIDPANFTNAGTITVSNGADMSIAPGLGLFGTLENDGQITVANGSTLSMEAGTFINTGFIEINGGAELDIVANSTVTQDVGGTVEIDGLLNAGGSTIDLAPDSAFSTVLDFGTLENATIVADGGTFEGGLLLADTWQGNLDVNGEETVVIQGGLTAESLDGTGPGTITIDGADANLAFNDTETFDNATITLGAANGLNELDANGTLTLGSGVTIQTAASVGFGDTLGGEGTLINDGTILDDTAGNFSIDPSDFINAGVITVSSGADMSIEPAFGLFGTLENDGQMTVSDGSTLSMESGTFINTGFIEIEGGAELDIFVRGTPTQDVGGTVEIEGVLNAESSTIDLGSNNAFSTILDFGTLENATIVADGGTFDGGLLLSDTWQGNLDVNGEETIFIQGGLTAQGAGGTGPGSITIDGTDATLAFNDTETFDNATITIGSDAGLNELDANGTLTLGSGVTIQTATTVGFGDTLGGQGTLINDGTILDSTAGDFFITPSDFTNAGTITVSNGADMSIAPAFGLFGTLENDGQITVASGSTLSMESGTFINTGSIEINGGAELDIFVSATPTQDVGGTVEIDGLLNAGGSTIDLGPNNAFSTVLDFGTLENATVIADGGTFEAGFGLLLGDTWQGNLDVNGEETVVIQGGLTAESLDGTGPGTITIDGADATLAFNDTETFDNATITLGAANGLDELDANGTLTLGSGVTVQTAATIEADTLGGQGTLINDGAILDSTAGDFFITPSDFINAGTITVSNGADMSIEPAFGLFSTLENDGQITVANGSTLSMESGTFINTGSIEINGGAELDIFVRATPTQDVGGTVEIDGLLNAGGSTIDLAPDSAFSTLLDFGTLENATVIADGGTFEGGLLKADTWQGNLDVSGEETVVIQGGLTAESLDGTGPGTITIDGADATLAFNDTETFDNATITIGAANGLNELDANGTLTLGSGVTIQTATSVGFEDTLGGEGTLINDGAILDTTAGNFFITPSDFINAGTITVSNGADMTIEPAFGLFGTLENDGQITVANASTLSMESGTFINTGSIEINGGAELDIFVRGTPTEDVGGTVEIDGLLNAEGSTIDLAPDSAFSTLLDFGTLENATVIADGGTFEAGFGLLKADTWQGNLDINGEETVVVQGGLTAEGLGGTGPGTITIDGADANLAFNDTETFDNATITIGSEAGLNELDANGTLTLGSGVTIQTAASVGFGDTLGGEGTLINDGTILDGTAGNFSIDPSDFINAGVITVSNGADMTIEPAFGLFGTLENDGQMTVSDGSTLSMESGTFINTGFIEIEGGAELDIFVRGTPTQDVGGTVEIEGVLNAESSTIDLGSNNAFSTTLDFGTLENATIVADGGTFDGGLLLSDTWQGNLDVNGEETIFIQGGLTAQGAGGTGPGSITIDGTDATLAFNDTETFDNATITIGSEAGLNELDANGTLTLGSGVTIQTAASTGFGVTLGGQGTLINDGTILDDTAGDFFITPSDFINAGEITVSNGADMTIEPAFGLFGTLENDGQMTVADGSTLSMESGTFINTGFIEIEGGAELDIFVRGTPTQDIGGTVEIEGVLNAEGSTIDLAADGAFSTVLDFGTLENATIVADGGTFDGGLLLSDTWQGNLDVNGEETIFIQGGLTAQGAGGTGPGSITIDGTDATLAFNDTETFDNATITIGSDAGLNELDANGTLTLGSGVTIQTASTVGFGDTLGGQGTLINGGTILDDTAGDFFITPSDFTNTGTVTVSNGADMSIAPAFGLFGTLENDGQITVASGSTLSLESGTLANTGTIAVNGGSLDITATQWATQPAGTDGVISLANGANVTFEESASADQQVTFLDGTGTLDLQSPGSFQATIVGFQAGDTIDLAGLADDTHSFADDTLTFSSNGTIDASIAFTGNLTAANLVLNPDGAGGVTVVEEGVACYCPGTLILTVRGEVPVEQLTIGDRVVTLSGALEPIRWIGRRSYAGRFMVGRRDILPVVIRQGALGDGLPRRDLRVSPLHAMYLDGVLVAAKDLVNGVSIVQDTQARQVDYIHIELAEHDVIWAEGAPSESYLDDDNRAMFHNAHEYVADTLRHGPALYCAPRVTDGLALYEIQQRIAAVAEALRNVA